MTTKITEQNVSNLANLGVQWQAVVTASTLNASAGKGYFINTTSNVCTVTLPATSASTSGDTIVLKDYARKWNTNNVTVASILTDGTTSVNTFSTDGQTVTLVYMDGTKGWSLINEDTTSNLIIPPTFIAATGGTVATSGDYKIHSFTGDSNFVVSSIGNATATPTGGPNAVSYLVVAGGGMGSTAHGGGGGAGGFREGRVAAPEHTASPLVAPGLTITAQTYPITVGGGGAHAVRTATGAGNPGSNSVFSTISSAGGGSIARYNTPTPIAAATKDGGSGSAASSHPDRIGAGNTPPVSPPQGNPGGSGPGGAPIYYGGGGGGATAAGATGNPSSGGAGGAGATTHITGSPVAYAGGGGGGIYNHPIGAVGGTGGGGQGNPAPGGYSGPVSDGTANTGGGGGGGAGAPGGAPNEGGGAGGKGIVVIKYKFQ